MKRCLTALIAFLLLLSGCRQNTSDPTTAPNTGSSGHAPKLPMVAVSLPATTESASGNDGTTLFRYTYQNISLVHPYPEVADKIIIDFLNRTDKADNTARGILTSAEAAYTGSANWIPYLYHIAYDAKRIDQSILSLSGICVQYSGASHAEQTCINANYNMITGDVLTLRDILTDGKSNLPQLVIDTLRKIQKEKRLYDGFEDTVNQRFNRDLTNDEEWYFSNDGLCFPFAPYELAPYSSGVIVAEIPYSSLLGILKDAYFPGELDCYNGTLTSEVFDPTNTSRFSRIAEVILQPGGEMLVLHTDETVDHVCIRLAGNEKADIPYIVFAAQQLTPEDAIVLELPKENPPVITVYYRSGGTIRTYQLP